MVPESPQYVDTGNHTQSIISDRFQDSSNEVLLLVINVKTPGGREALLIEINTMILEQQKR